MIKGKDYNCIFFTSYLSFAILGSNIAIGFIAMSHIILFIWAVYFLQKKLRKFSDLKNESSTTYKNLVILLLTFIIIILISLITNFESAINLLNSIQKVKYYLVILLLIYLVDNNFLEINLLRISNFILIISSIASVYGLYNYLLYGGRLGSFAGVMNFPHNLAIIIVFNCSVLLAKQNSKSILFKSLYLTGITVNSLAIYLSYTRGAWLALGGGIILLLFISKIKLIHKTIIICILPFIMYYGTDFSLHFFGNHREESNHVRFELIKFGFKTIKENPFTGIGYKQFGNFFKTNHKKYDITYINESESDHAHNTYIEICATTGIIGVSILLTIIIYWINIIYSNKTFKLIFLPATLCILISGLTHHNFGIAENLTFITVMIVISLVLIKNENDLVT